MSDIRRDSPAPKPIAFGPGPGRGPGGHAPLGIPGEKPKDAKGTLRKLAGYLKGTWFSLSVVLLAAILSTLFSIAGPAVMGRITTLLFTSVTEAVSGGALRVDFPQIGRILAILALLYILSSAFSYLQQFLITGVSQKIVFSLRRDAQGKLDTLPLAYFDTHTHGEILSRVSNDIDTISTTLQQTLTQLVTSLVTIVGVFVMMLVISPLLTLIAVITIPLALLVTKGIAGKSRRHFSAQQKALGELTGQVEEAFSGHVVIKAYGREGATVRTFEAVNERLFEAGWKAQFISGIVMPLMMLINNLGYVVSCVAGGIMAASGTLSVGNIQAFLQYLRNFTQPMTQLAQIVNVIQSTMAAAERVFNLLEEAEESSDAEGSSRLPDAKGEVAFTDVRFSYLPEKPLLEGVNLDVKPGQVVAIVGPTGAGKTTLVNLLLRFYEIDGGSIFLDGRDIRSFKRGELRAMTGMVLQDTWLFNGSIFENIAYGKEGASREDVHRAAELAQADHFIRTLPEGYDTVLNEEASNISQGQRQLLTIARAILSNPAVLILDEATSSVDTRTEMLIQKGLRVLMAERTSFVIAHRLSTIRDAALILVMEAGHIVEQGTHQELLDRGGSYAELYQSQFSGGAEAAP